MSQSGRPTSFTFDPNGNLTSDGSKTYTWDAENRLVRVSEGASSIEFVYDGRSRRVQILQKANGAITDGSSFVWSGMTICEERSTVGATRRFFAHGVQGNGVAYFYARDHLGSIRELTDTAGLVRARYGYDPYGRSTKLAGDMDGTFGFSGHFSEEQVGLVLAAYRAYDPTVGRWISEDPSWTGEYAYVGNNPVGYWDPDGREALTVTAGGAIALTAGGGAAAGAGTATGGGLMAAATAAAPVAGAAALAVGGIWLIDEVLAPLIVEKFPPPPPSDPGGGSGEATTTTAPVEPPTTMLPPFPPSEPYCPKRVVCKGILAACLKGYFTGPCYTCAQICDEQKKWPDLCRLKAKPKKPRKKPGRKKWQPPNWEDPD